MVSINYLPLAIISVVLVIVAAGRASSRVNALLSSFALATFGSYQMSGNQPNRKRLLQSAYIGTPYRVYAAKTLLYSTIAAVCGSVLGVYLVSGILIVVPELITATVVDPLPLPPEFLNQIRSLPDITVIELFSLLLLSGATVGVGSWFLTYQLRWIIPELRADSRRRRIELSMPRTIAFMYALSRGGLEIPRILRILERHQAIYGESAREMAVAGRAINVFGMDTVTAIRHVSRRTPSDQFRIFTENLSSVLQSGRSIPDFFNEQYEQYQEEAEVQQELFLDRLGAIAEGYVALFVVGPLFLITVLLIFGLISGGTQTAMESIIYLFIPLLNLGFIYYLDNSTQPIDATADVIERGEDETWRSPSVRDEAGTDNTYPVTDGGPGGVRQSPESDMANIERIVAFDRVRAIKVGLSNPLQTARENPQTVLIIVVPLALLWLGFGFVYLLSRGQLALRTVDEFVVQSMLIAFVPFAIARYFHTNRLREIERVVPDLFNRLASLNESGIEIVNALREIRHGDLGILTPELHRIWTDIEFGMNVEQALTRFEIRTRAPSTRRAVTLIRNGMKASGNIGPVLRIAADESRRLNSLKRERESEMSIYLIIIYLSFLVFLTIIFVLVETFIPAIPSQESLEGSGLAGAAAGITREQAETFTMLLFHASLIQATFSGLIAGHMSQGSIRDGAIHVVILLITSYLLFSLIG